MVEWSVAAMVGLLAAEMAVMMVVMKVWLWVDLKAEKMAVMTAEL